MPLRRAGGGPLRPGQAGASLRALGRSVRTAEDRSLQVVALALVRQIVLLLSLPGTGRLYRRGRRRWHRASKPGHPPAVDTGRLRGSIGYERVAEGLYRVGTNVVYAPYLEFGTMGPEYTGGSVAPRPFMRPALSAVRRWWGRQVLADLIRAAQRPARGHLP
jgi:phage gpG-like protein